MLENRQGKNPRLAPGSRIHESAVLIGPVEVGEQSSIWPCAILRADVDEIHIGKRTSIQDGCVVHTDFGVPAIVGNDCVIGHQACLHACTIGDRSLVGIHAIVLSRAVIGEECIIGAGALVGEGRVIPPRSLVLGVPGRVVRQVTDEEAQAIQKGATEYLELMKQLPETK
jgi:carbonic anhydrase/acetyltransferase-like protein (isoleucine patch superfamily)